MVLVQLSESLNENLSNVNNQEGARERTERFSGFHTQVITLSDIVASASKRLKLT